MLTSGSSRQFQLNMIPVKYSLEQTPSFVCFPYKSNPLGIPVSSMFTPLSHLRLQTRPQVSVPHSAPSPVS